MSLKVNVMSILFLAFMLVIIPERAVPYNVNAMTGPGPPAGAESYNPGETEPCPLSGPGSYSQERISPGHNDPGIAGYNNTEGPGHNNTGIAGHNNTEGPGHNDPGIAGAKGENEESAACHKPVHYPGSPRAAPFDVVINEIMARPSPPVGLPAAEYIELFNRSDRPVNLNNWTIWVGTRYRVLPEHILMPGAFLLIAHEKFTPELEEFGDVTGLPTFPVLAMGGQTIVLKDERENVISAVSYSDRWYGSTLKASGGWSLEQIDPFNPCGGEKNWTASTSSLGGTPGSPNSVRGDNPDNEPPELVRASLLSPGSLRLHFSKPMHPLSGWSDAEYHLEGKGHPLAAVPAEPLFDKTDLYFHGHFEEGKDHILTTGGGLYDCAGNFINPDATEVKFSIPSYPLRNDIIINEILFNPFPGGANFLELVNISANTIDMKNLILAGMNQGIPDPAYIISPGGYLLFPGDYVVITTDSEVVRSHYYTPNPRAFAEMERMPYFYNEKGRVAITDLQMNIIDELSYTADMHSPLLTDRKGVSLERISFRRPASDPNNWLSASENAGFATPGYRNSQFSEVLNPPADILGVEPRIFSPDNSGYNDVVNISYRLDRSGYAGSITIYDSRGRIVKRLVRNELFGTSGVYSWDGRNDANSQSRLGIYLILMELFHPDGEVQRYRETVVLGGRLRR